MICDGGLRALDSGGVIEIFAVSTTTCYWHLNTSWAFEESAADVF